MMQSRKLHKLDKKLLVAGIAVASSQLTLMGIDITYKHPSFTVFNGSIGSLAGLVTVTGVAYHYYKNLHSLKRR
jgi:hypothetical protein